MCAAREAVPARAIAIRCCPDEPESFALKPVQDGIGLIVTNTRAASGVSFLFSRRALSTAPAVHMAATTWSCRA